MLILQRNVSILNVRATSMKSYLKNTLGIIADIQTWIPKQKLPAHLSEGTEFFLLTVCGIVSLVLKVNQADFQMQEFQRHKLELRQYCDFQIVLCFDRITSYQRKILIENRQPFIVPDNQLYMPFLGIALQEHFISSTDVGEQMTAMAQFVLLSFLYDKSEDYRSKMDISERLNINLMNVSRSVQELEELGFLQTKKKGRSSMVCTTMNKQALFETAYPMLRDPIQKRLFVRSSPEILKLPLSGEEALWSKGYGERPERKIRAIEKKQFNDTMRDIENVDPNWVTDTEVVELEVWRYSPIMFSNGDFVDTVSLALTSENASEALSFEIKQILS